MEGYAQRIMLLDVSVPTVNGDAAERERELAARLESVSKELERHTSHADMVDYSLAVASGILAGAVDAAFVGSGAPATPQRTKPRGSVSGTAKVSDRVAQSLDQAQQLTNAPIYKFLAGSPGELGEALSDIAETVSALGEKRLPKVVLARLEGLSHKPTPVGLAAAIAIRLLRAAQKPLQKKTGQNGRVANQNDADGTRIIRLLIVPATMAALLNWLVDAGTAVEFDVAREPSDGEVDVRELPWAMQALASLVRDQPVIAKVAKRADKWFERQARTETLPSVSVMLLSLLEDVARLPEFKRTELATCLRTVRRAQKELVAPGLKDFAKGHDLQLPTNSALNEQALPVLVNESIVRLGFFVRMLVRGWGDAANLTAVEWERFMPFGNRTVERMIAVSSVTLSMFDAIDASVVAARACVESSANWALASQKLATNINFVAAGRATIAVVREVKEESIERQLLRERRLLAEEKSELAVARLQAYKTQLFALLDEYLAERLEAFFKGLKMMDAGLAAGDSNLVIGGNVVIQRALGYEPQFVNSEEFDALMDSDEDFDL